VALYDEIGGAPAVRAVLDAFYPRVIADPMLSPFFLGVDLERLKKTQEGFLSMALGGPNTYAGRGLHDGHARTRRRGANEEVFDHFLVIFSGVLVDLGVPEGKRREVIAIVEDARGQVLNV